jgi:hypothetical protein
MKSIPGPVVELALKLLVIKYKKQTIASFMWGSRVPICAGKS